jgi:hypothetical protein
MARDVIEVTLCTNRVSEDGCKWNRMRGQGIAARIRHGLKSRAQAFERSNVGQNACGLAAKERRSCLIFRQARNRHHGSPCGAAHFSGCTQTYPQKM